MFSDQLTHQFSTRIYYEDTDTGGVVYHARYLHFMDRARTEWLREKGLEQQALSKMGILFAVRRVSINYRRPAYLDDLIIVLSKPRLESEKIMSFSHNILKGDIGLVQAEVQLVCVTSSPFRACPIPKSITTLMECEVEN